ncbi:MAG TPA: hypothetical protein PK843_19490 [bacterium]|nr:hypothetical protein [bacterium]
MKRSWFFALFLVSATGPVQAQQGDLSLHLFASVSQPSGDFGKDIGPNAGATRRNGYYVGDRVGLAQTGYGMGAELITPVWFKGMNWLFSVKGLVNGVDSRAVTSDFAHHLGDSLNPVMDFGSWYNIPIMTGFRYNYYFSHQIAIFGLVQAGINLAKAPAKKITVGSIVGEDTKFEFARDFGYEIGLGLLWNQTYNLCFRYLQLSKPRFDGDQRLSELVFPHIYDRNKALLGEERSISMFVVTLGVQLFR